MLLVRVRFISKSQVSLFPRWASQSRPDLIQSCGSLQTCLHLRFVPGEKYTASTESSSTIFQEISDFSGVNGISQIIYPYYVGRADVRFSAIWEKAGERRRFDLIFRYYSEIQRILNFIKDYLTIKLAFLPVNVKLFMCKMRSSKTLRKRHFCRCIHNQTEIELRGVKQLERASMLGTQEREGRGQVAPIEPLLFKTKHRPVSSLLVVETREMTNSSAASGL